MTTLRINFVCCYFSLNLKWFDHNPQDDELGTESEYSNNLLNYNLLIKLNR